MPRAKKLNRFHGTVSLDPLRKGRDAARIAEEVVQHLAGSTDAAVEITVEIYASLPEGASEKLVRDLSANCRTLKSTSHWFEKG